MDCLARKELVDGSEDLLVDLLQLVQGDLEGERFALLLAGRYFDLGGQHIVRHILGTERQVSGWWAETRNPTQSLK